VPPNFLQLSIGHLQEAYFPTFFVYKVSFEYNLFQGENYLEVQDEKNCYSLRGSFQKAMDNNFMLVSANDF